MKPVKVLLVAVDLIFDALELIGRIADGHKARKKAKELTLDDLLTAKRDGELLRRSQARTVVIPPPSERERTQRR